MTLSKPPGFVAFEGHRRLASGELPTVALAVRQAMIAGPAGTVLLFDNHSGRQIDIDLRGSEADMLARLPTSDLPPETSPVSTGNDEPRGRGRPKLGVVAREVTLLPRHWEWLGAQPGGASVALRKLVEEARRSHGDRHLQRQAQERAYQFMSALAGDLPGFEEASRALFANDRTRFAELVAPWPGDISEHALQLAFDSADAP